MKTKTAELIGLLTEFFELYLPADKGLSTNTVTSYQYAFQLLFEFLYETKGLPPEKVSLADLTGGIISDYLRYLETERKCSAATRNIRRAAMVTFAKFAAKKSFSSALSFYSEVMDLPSKKAPKNDDVKYFTKEEIVILLKMPNTSRSIGQRDVTLLSMLYSTGARAQEICDLTLEGVTFSNPVKIRLVGKGNKPRFVTIPDNCAAILRGYLTSRRLDVQNPAMQRRYVFSSQTHEHMTISCVEELVKKYVTAAKQAHPNLFKRKSYTPHSFRHSIAVHMLEAGESLVAIKAFLGHASIESTTVYAKVTPELANKYLNERGKPLENVQHVADPVVAALPFLPRKYMLRQHKQ